MVLAGKHIFLFMNLLAVYCSLFKCFTMNTSSCITVSLSTVTFKLEVSKRFMPLHPKGAKREAKMNKGLWSTTTVGMRCPPHENRRALKITEQTAHEMSLTQLSLKDGEF